MSNFKNAENFKTAIVEALKARNADYAAAKGAPSKDIAAIVSEKPNGKFKVTVHHAQMLIEMGLGNTEFIALIREWDEEKGKKDAGKFIGVKALKRMMQFLRVLIHKDVRMSDSTTFSLIACAHVLDGELPKDVARYALKNVEEGEGLSDLLKGRSIARFRRVKGDSTADTQSSRSVGSNGFLVYLGVMSEEGGKLQLHSASPVTQKVLEVMNSASDAHVKELQGKDEEIA